MALKKGRPKKVRYIQNMPRVVQFSPRGRPGRPDEVELTLDEFEAIKLADFQDFNQDEGAMVVRVSRASFGRILRAARKKVADALVNGKIIRIRMGDVQVGVQKRDFERATLDKEIKEFKKRNRKLSAEVTALNLKENRDPSRKAAGQGKKAAAQKSSSAKG